MIKSMTGYGRTRELRAGRCITVDVRSVNNRYFDCTVKMPRAFLFAEDAIKARVKDRISRGKVDVFISVENLDAEESVVRVNEPLARAYLAALTQLRELGGAQVEGGVSLSDLARLPDVLCVSKAEEDVEGLRADLCAVVEQALDSYQQMRQTEGERLAEDLLARLARIEELTAAVERRSPETVTAYRERLLERMREVLGSSEIDPARVLTEAALFADKVAVDEETVRLRSHLAQFREMIRAAEPMGRRMDFLIQEMNRESNTIGSKCCDLQITRDVVELKSEIEKIREQVQNIE